MDVEDVDVKTVSKIYRATTYTSLPEAISYQSIGKGQAYKLVDELSSESIYNEAGYRRKHVQHAKNV